MSVKVAPGAKVLLFLCKSLGRDPTYWHQRAYRTRHDPEVSDNAKVSPRLLCESRCEDVSRSVRFIIYYLYPRNNTGEQIYRQIRTINTLRSGKNCSTLLGRHFQSNSVNETVRIFDWNLTGVYSQCKAEAWTNEDQVSWRIYTLQNVAMAYNDLINVLVFPFWSRRIHYELNKLVCESWGDGAGGGDGGLYRDITRRESVRLLGAWGFSKRVGLIAFLICVGSTSTAVNVYIVLQFIASAFISQLWFQIA